MGINWRKKTAEVNETPVSEGITTGASAGDVTRAHAEELEKFQKAHKWDLYIDSERLDTVDAVVASGDIEKEAALEESLLEEDSPYQEVRISVSVACFIRIDFQRLTLTQIGPTI
jgi:hypothetical protein